MKKDDTNVFYCKNCTNATERSAYIFLA